MTDATWSHPGEVARRAPDRVAHVMAETGEAVTYSELEERSRRIARVLAEAGLSFGQHLAIVLENSARVFEVCWAAQRMGLYYTMVSTRLTPREAAYIVNDCEARVIVTSEAMAALATELVPLTPRVERRFSLGRVEGHEDLATAMEAHPAEPLEDELEGVAMLYSSGTTGQPKGVLRPLERRPLGTYNPVAPLMGGAFGFRDGAVYLSPAPLYHAAPLGWSMSTQRYGGTVVVMERFDARGALAAISRHRVTHGQFVPTMFVRMLKLPAAEREQADITSLAAVVHAAAPCPVEVKRQMIAWWGPILHEYYAGTEGNGITYITPQEWLEHEGSVGRPLVGRVHIVGPDGEDLPPGQMGTVYFSGGPPFAYHNDPERTALSHDRAGRSTLGDVGYVDDDGYLYLTDRKAFTIVSGGVNIYPREIEDVLVLHPEVVDVAVFGAPNEEYGEEVKAVVQPAAMASASADLERALIDFCRERLAAFKCPRSVDFVAELPRHPTGKLYKDVLRERYWRGHSTRIV